MPGAGTAIAITRDVTELLPVKNRRPVGIGRLFDGRGPGNEVRQIVFGNTGCVISVTEFVYTNCSAQEEHADADRCQQVEEKNPFTVPV